MDPRDLRHLIDTYLEAAGLPACSHEPAGYLVLPLTESRNLGVQWQPGGEALLFANVGHVRERRPEPDPREEPDLDDDEEGDEVEDLGVDEHGRWSLHVNGLTALASLCLQMPPRTPEPQEFAAAVDAFRERFAVRVASLDLQASMDRPDGVPLSSESFASGEGRMLRV